MSDYPNLDRLGENGANDLTERQIQVLVVLQEVETPVPTEAERAVRTARLGNDVPALLAHIDELYGDIENLRMKAQYDRDQRADAVRQMEKARFEVTQIAIDTSPAYAQLRNERDSAYRERDEAMRKLDQVREDFLRWLVRMDEPNKTQGSADRQTVTLNQIIEKARHLLGDAR